MGSCGMWRIYRSERRAAQVAEVREQANAALRQAHAELEASKSRAMLAEQQACLHLRILPACHAAYTAKIP